MVFHREVNGKSTELIESIVLGYRELFKKTTPFQPSERLKKALLIVFPEIPPEETEVLDLAHATVAVEFDFVDPLRAVRKARDCEIFHRFNECGVALRERV